MGSDTVLSTETHRKPFSGAHPQSKIPGGKEFWASVTSMHPCPNQPPHSLREGTLLPLGIKGPSWFLSELSRRAGSKSCSFDTEAQTEKLLLPWLVSKGRKRKNPGESVIAFTPNLPSETLLPPGPISNLYLAHVSNIRHQTQKGPPPCPRSVTLTSEWQNL